MRPIERYGWKRKIEWAGKKNGNKWSENWAKFGWLSADQLCFILKTQALANNEVIQAIQKKFQAAIEDEDLVRCPSSTTAWTKYRTEPHLKKKFFRFQIFPRPEIFRSSS